MKNYAYVPSKHIMDFHIAGFAYYDGLDIIEELQLGQYVTLVCEPTNPYDHCAVAIYYKHYKLGYIPQTKNELIHLLLFYQHQDVIEARIQYVHLKNHPERQFRVVVTVKDCRKRNMMKIRKARLEDLNQICVIYEEAKLFMRSMNNHSQWINYPNENTVIEDISNQKLYVCVEDDIVGVFYFDFNDDETYYEIDGQWLNDKKYGVVHRIAVKKHHCGIGEYCLLFAFNLCKNLKIDTHEDNVPMKNLLYKLGFELCGTIKLKNGDLRIAFQKSN